MTRVDLPAVEMSYLLDEAAFAVPSCLLGSWEMHFRVQAYKRVVVESKLQVVHCHKPPH